MKQPLPFTTKHFNQIKELHREAVDRYKQDQQKIYYTQIHELREKMLEYENAVLYNKYAVSHCKFGHSIDTEECCEKIFHQTPRHYSIHGNCCQSCSNYFSYMIKPKVDDVIVDDIIKQDIQNLKVKMGEFLTKIEEEKKSEKFKMLSTL